MKSGSLGAGTPSLGRLAAFGLVALIVCLFREPLFEGGVFYQRDIHLVWYPQAAALARAIHSGSWPLWDSGTAFGEPLLADPAVQVLYPPTWLSLLVAPWTYYTLFAVTHVLFSALSFRLLAQRWHVSSAGSLVAAVLWTVSGPFLSLIDLWHHFAGASWIPLALLAGDRAFESRRAREALQLGLVLGGQILAGSADMCAMTILALAALAGARHLAWRRGAGASNRAVLLSGAGALAVALGLSAGLWLPALDVLSRSARSDLPGAMRTYWSVHPLGILETLIPGLWSSLPLHPRWRAALFESREPFLSSLYLGLPALGLVGAALVASPRRRFLLGLGAGATLLALGRHTPVYDLVLLALPPLRILRYPVKAMVFVSFAWALLAGLGYDVWRANRAVPRRRWALLVVTPAALLLAVDAALAVLARSAPEAWARFFLDLPATAPDPASVLSPTAAKLAVGTALAGLLVLLSLARARGWAPAPWLAGALALLAAGDLAAFHRHPDPVAPRALYLHRPEVLNALGDLAKVRLYAYDYTAPGSSARVSPPAHALQRAPAGWTPDAAFALGMQMSLAPQSAVRWGLRTGFEIDYLGLSPEPLHQMTLVLREVEGTPAHLRLLQIGGITHVVALHERGFEDLRPLAVLPGLFKQPIRLFEVPDPRPRTYAVGGARVANGAAAILALLATDFDVSQQVVLPEAPPPEAGPAFAGTSRITEDLPDRVRLEAELAAPGYVVLLDGYDPGWRARLDGRPAPVLRANVAFRAVAVPAGRHVLEFEYRPWAVTVGLGLCGITLVLTALAWRRARPPAAEREREPLPSRQLLEEHRRVWAKKPVLADVYRVWFDALLEAVPTGARVWEVGAGPGFLSSYARGRFDRGRWVATDLIETPWNDVTADGLRLPVRGGALGALVGLDLLHHLAHPASFFAEAARVLPPRGRIVVVEPWVTPFSYPIYRWLHQEGCTLGLDPWNPFALAEGEGKDAFEGDAAVVWRLVRNTPAGRWRSLGFDPPRVRLLNGFAYLLSLGFKEGSLLPRRAAPFFIHLDEVLRGAARGLAMRALLVWDRLG